MNYPLLDAFLSMLWLFLWILWLFLVVTICLSVIGSDDLSGWAKAGWILLVILLPFLGVIIYLIVRGTSLHKQSARSTDIA